MGGALFSVGPSRARQPGAACAGDTAARRRSGPVAACHIIREHAGVGWRRACGPRTPPAGQQSTHACCDAARRPQQGAGRRSRRAGHAGKRQDRTYQHELRSVAGSSLQRCRPGPHIAATRRLRRTGFAAPGTERAPPARLRHRAAAASCCLELAGASTLALKNVAAYTLQQALQLKSPDHRSWCAGGQGHRVPDMQEDCRGPVPPARLAGAARRHPAGLKKGFPVSRPAPRPTGGTKPPHTRPAGVQEPRASTPLAAGARQQQPWRS